MPPSASSTAHSRSSGHASSAYIVATTPATTGRSISSNWTPARTATREFCFSKIVPCRSGRSPCDARIFGSRRARESNKQDGAQLRMLEVRRSLDRGYAENRGLKSYHTFSFGEYYDPVYEDFGALRVINEDRIKPRRGYDSAPPKDMEVLTYLLGGELEHRDSLGNTCVVRPGGL